MFALLISLFCFIPLFSLSEPTDIQSYLDLIEQRLIDFSGEFEKDYSNRCTNQCYPSYDGCSTIMPLFYCATEFKVDSCSCYSPGSPINITVSVVKLADSSGSHPNETDQDVKEMICSTSDLDAEFIKVRQNIPSIKWHYIGTYNGIVRTYPGITYCFDYDPRIRPCYIAAASG